MAGTLTESGHRGQAARRRETSLRDGGQKCHGRRPISTHQASRRHANPRLSSRRPGALRTAVGQDTPEVTAVLVVLGILVALGLAFWAASPPADAGPAWSPASGLPDLVGDHWRPPTTRLVEAEGSRRTGLRVLAKGVLQLTGRGLMSGAHVRVLCGASLEPRLVVTVDMEVLSDRAPWTAPPEVPDPASDDSLLVSLARSRMLTYYSLRALTVSALAVRPVGLAAADPESWRRRAGLVYPLEGDPSTQLERSLAQDPSAYAEQRPLAQRLDILTGRVPGTNSATNLSAVNAEPHTTGNLCDPSGEQHLIAAEADSRPASAGA